MKLRTVIVEDELPSLQRLKELLANFDNIEVIGCAHDGQQAVEMIDGLKPNLAFLDIQLPVFTSFEVLKRLHHRPNIIFVTAYDQYAIKAFEENAVDYLLKPTTPERLQRAIDKVVRLNRPVDQDLLEVLRNALEQGRHPERFSVKIGDEIIFIPASDIYFFRAQEKYVFLNTFDREHIIDLTLKELDVRLNPDNFLRIHKSTIIAIDKISRVRRSFSGKFKVQLLDSKRSSFEIGRTFLTGVRERLKF